MGKIWEFFENMDELVYVSDADSYELLYMNKKALQTFGFGSVEEAAGKKCYEVLQNCSMPCTICNNHELKPGYFKEWRYYNPVLDRYFLLKDTIQEENGRRYRIELSLDVTSQERRGSMLQNFQNLEAMINEGLRVALQGKTPTETLEVMLEYLGKALKGERTYIFEKNKDGGDDNTYEWVANGVRPEKDNLQNVPPEVCANWYRNFREGRHIVIKDLEEIREKDPLQYEILKRQNIHSLVVVPIYEDGKAIGFYGVDNPPVTSLEYTSNMLQIMAHFILASLRRRNLVRELVEMSYFDQLTKIGNRHAMNEYIEHIQKGQSIGIIYCDVTGLKQLNDREGHKAGDQLLVSACECLRTALGEEGLFRAGGDEFLAICLQIEEHALWEKVKLLNRKLQEASVQMAVGAIWEEKSQKDMDRLIAEAEKNMYKEKAEFYRRSGIERRRQ